ncbi:HdeD family acid-resistance protein [Archangium sp.]|uniref:HdeD family acid-resistance protein n=1 Tax=Archangium sp. TaxID=1872627 RepID=UPI00389A34BD
MPITRSPIDSTRDDPWGLNTPSTSSLWRGPFVMGLLIALLGVLALASVPITSLATVLFYGALLVVGGIFEVVHAFRVRTTGPFLMFLLGGLLSIVVGALVLMRPGVGLVSLTLLMAGFFFARGLFRGITAVMDRYSGWGWDLVYGLVSLALGIIIFAQLPYSTMWALGLVVGVEILSRGISIMAVALMARSAMRRAHV